MQHSIEAAFNWRKSEVIGQGIETKSLSRLDVRARLWAGNIEVPLLLLGPLSVQISWVTKLTEERCALRCNFTISHSLVCQESRLNLFNLSIHTRLLRPVNESDVIFTDISLLLIYNKHTNDSWNTQ